MKTGVLSVESKYGSKEKSAQNLAHFFFGKEGIILPCA